jgi:hypothetical protein
MLPFLPLLEVYFVKKRRQARWDGKVRENAQEVAVVSGGWREMHEARCLEAGSRAKDMLSREGNRYLDAPSGVTEAQEKAQVVPRKQLVYRDPEGTQTTRKPMLPQ